MMAKQVVSDVLACLILAWLLSQAIPVLPTLVSRIGFVCAICAFSFLVSEVPYWNWYRFPASFTAYALVFKLTCGVVSGFVLSKLLAGTKPAAA